MDYLGLFLGEIINNYGSANAKFQGYKEYLIPCDANSNFLMLEDQSIFEYDISSIL